MTSEQLKRLEDNHDIKKTYAAAGSFGGNKWVALPACIFVFSLFGTYFMYGIAKQDPGYYTAMYACIALALISFVTAIMMQRAAMRKTLAGITTVPACVGKKIYGNDNTDVYYCIYTTGDRRHDKEFIDHIAAKIYNIDDDYDPELRRKIDKLFSPKFESVGSPAVLLPDAITEGEKVYHRQLKVKKGQDTFPLLAFNDNATVVVVNLEDLH